jgi:hypothetical protein
MPCGAHDARRAVSAKDGKETVRAATPGGRVACTVPFATAVFPFPVLTKSGRTDVRFGRLYSIRAGGSVIVL